MPVAHCVSSIAGIILDVDEGFCRLVQRTPKTLVGLSYKAITAPADLHKSREMLRGLVDKAAPTHLRKRYVRPDGGIVKADLLVSKFSNEGRLISTLSWLDGTRQTASPSRLWKTALQIKHLYDLRIKEFGRDLFSDHVGLILVHAYLAEAEGRVAGVREISADIDLPIETTARWVRLLDQRGFIVVLDDQAGLIQLSHEGASKLDRLLSAMLSPNAPPDQADWPRPGVAVGSK